MVKVNVYLSNDFDGKFEEIKITKEEIIQLAQDKAKGKYTDGHWHTVEADDVEVTGSF